MGQHAPRHGRRRWWRRFAPRRLLRLYETISHPSNKVEGGRPRKEVDFAIVMRMREERKLGWSKMARAHRGLTGQYISRDTIKHRYLEAVVKEGEQ